MTAPTSIIRHQLAGPPVGRWVRAGAIWVWTGVATLLALTASGVTAAQSSATDRASQARHAVGFGLIAVGVAGLAGLWWGMLAAGLLVIFYDLLVG